MSPRVPIVMIETRMRFSLGECGLANGLEPNGVLRRLLDVVSGSPGTTDACEDVFGDLVLNAAVGVPEEIPPVPLPLQV
jgi:hypothetical protein